MKSHRLRITRINFRLLLIIPHFSQLLVTVFAFVSDFFSMTIGNLTTKILFLSLRTIPSKFSTETILEYSITKLRMQKKMATLNLKKINLSRRTVIFTVLQV